MGGESLTGSRIRERRLMLGQRQADLAREVGISASYLNLIEHNRRRIGGKLLIRLARALGVEPSALTEGVEATLIAALREAAADTRSPAVELDRVDEFAGRFPGWAEVLAQTQARIAMLERTVRSLSDRLTHDPHLADSLHEVLSTAASIRSTAAILAEPGGLEPQWQSRFTRNLNQDAERLADSSRALVRFLDESDTEQDRRGLPQEEVEAFLAAHGFHFAALEQQQATPGELIEAAGELDSAAARRMALGVLQTYQDDARAVPLEAIAQALAQGTGRDALPDPAALARLFEVPLAVMLRRIAALPQEVLGQPTGLVVCDASGAILFRKPVAGFTLPRFGASCPLWPLFTALSHPGTPIRRQVRQNGRNARECLCYATSWSIDAPDFDRDPIRQAAMLILPHRMPAALVERGDGAGASAQAAEGRGAFGASQPVGTTCRICLRDDCVARREPSILRDETLSAVATAEGQGGAHGRAEQPPGSARAEQPAGTGQTAPPGGQAQKLSSSG